MLGLLALANAAMGQPGGPTEYVSLKAIPSHTTVAAGETFTVALVVDVEPGWVLYSPDPVVSSDYEPGPALLEVSAEGFEVVETLWPVDSLHSADVAGLRLDSYGYEDRAVIYVRMRADGSTAGETKGESATISLTLDAQICEQLCIPFKQSASITVALGNWHVPNGAWTEELAAGETAAVTVEQLRERHGGGAAATSVGADAPDYPVWIGLLLALLVGLILNIMPCVLPVIPIRILTIVQSAGDSRRRFVTLGLAFAAGVLLFFVGLAGVNVVLRVVFNEVFAWGAHFGWAPFRITMGLVMVALAANLFGAFHIVVPKQIVGLDSGMTARSGSHGGAMGMGVMLAVLATPCSFALLVGVLSWAQAQSLAVGTVAIVVIGMGMAAPHALLTAFPKLVDRLPKPGRWMELFKQGMGFAILGVAVWLFGTLIAEDSSDAVWVLGYAVVLATALWIWGTWLRYDAPLRQKLIVRGLAVVLAVAAGWAMLRPAGEPTITFEHFDSARISAARADGRTVLVKFTASWCLSCKVVDYTVFSKTSTAEALADNDVLVMKGDVTNRNSLAYAYLHNTLAGNVPLTVVYPPSGDPIRLVGEFSTDDLIEALQRSSGTD